MTTKNRSNNVSELKLSLAERIKRARLSQKWTRPMLAERANVNQYTLKRFELSGEISLCDFLALCEALGGLSDLKRLFKPRCAVNVDSWSVEMPQIPQRGARQTKPKPA